MQSATNFTSLSQELYLYISEFLDSIPDLNSFAQVNSTLYDLLNKRLYRRDAAQTQTQSHGQMKHALFWAARHDQVGTARKAVAAGADVLAMTDEDNLIKGCTPLMLAAAHGNLEVLRYLLTIEEANPNLRDRRYMRPPISWAVRAGHIFVVAALLDDDRVDVNLQDNMGNTALMIAINHRPGLVTLLLCSGRADPRVPNRQGATALSSAARNRNADVGLLLATHLDLILDGHDTAEDCQHVFFFAASTGHVDTVKYLVSAHGDKLKPNGKSDEYVRGAFWAAASSRRVEVIRFLLSWKATDPNLRNPWRLHTPLFAAAMNGHEDVVDVLMESERVDPEIPDVYGVTPLGTAADRGHEDIVKRLLTGKRRADPNARDENGQTPLFSAAFSGHLDVVQILLEAEGIDPNLPDLEGKTPLAVATENGNSKVAEVLRDNKTKQ
ncbi:hypothetical protein N7474_005845 [Penicillium riverlandense]|uniref:uncharacterized protein n=1 Tax=Penicillium riverlandense TaxID=1903569 RepID=UPI002548CF7B|nr:uncharacterized protein N7474_005845 [Penicillium riverlandense]KAJ5820254.1 hypothetical protein N7474_005845 [Penicillium riverlandense]